MGRKIRRCNELARLFERFRDRKFVTWAKLARVVDAGILVKGSRAAILAEIERQMKKAVWRLFS